MPINEALAEDLNGMYHDVLRAPDGRIFWNSGWKKNAIVVDCRSLLAALLGGKGALPIQGLLLGAGSAAWDVTGPPPATSAQTALVDPSPFKILATDPNFKIEFLAGGIPSPNATNRLQIAAKLGPGQATGSLREFGLYSDISGKTVLINYVTHTVITKDPASTLDRTVWLTF